MLPSDLLFCCRAKGTRTPCKTCRKAAWTAVIVKSLRYAAEKNRAGNTYRLRWRHDGPQRSLTFENLLGGVRFKTLLENHGPEEAFRIIGSMRSVAMSRR
jgi:hypothetical protein